MAKTKEIEAPDKFIRLDPEYHALLVEMADEDNRPYRAEAEVLIKEAYERRAAAKAVQP